MENVVNFSQIPTDNSVITPNLRLYCVVIYTENVVIFDKIPTDNVSITLHLRLCSVVIYVDILKDHDPKREDIFVNLPAKFTTFVVSKISTVKEVNPHFIGQSL